MCRLVAYKGPPTTLETLVTLPENSLVYQSRDAGYHPSCGAKRNIRVNGDGFGIAWYHPDKLCGCIIKFPTPAWSSTNLLELGRFVDSGLILAHVRAASDGQMLTGRISYENCHPFKMGRWTFMHNGAVFAFQEIRRGLMASLRDATYACIEGNTDSEVCFGIFLDEMHAEGAARVGGEGMSGGCPLQQQFTAQEIAAALRRTISRIVGAVAEYGSGGGSSSGGSSTGSSSSSDAGDSECGPCSLNFVVTDGRHIVASRYRNHSDQQPPSLYMITGERFVCDGDGSCLRPIAAEARTSVVISSEPLCRTTKGWTLIPKNHVVVVSGDLEDAYRVDKIDVQPLRCHSSDSQPTAADALRETVAAEANPYLNSPKLGRDSTSDAMAFEGTASELSLPEPSKAAAAAVAAGAAILLRPASPRAVSAVDLAITEGLGGLSERATLPLQAA